ncbi:hypothetical protein Nwat_2679 [Nitrosococcus watsonii C-113]|uniref:Uncharacterized protein n=1 Tax=Nitrosococcus watsoni (strain C-113) TaxID=105559 RepID=D8KAM5_NITWC|nr:hypothetical protein Nwat_2679 [Nitrosococcus watsonii C-113]
MYGGKLARQIHDYAFLRTMYVAALETAVRFLFWSRLILFYVPLAGMEERIKPLQ